MTARIKLVHASADSSLLTRMQKRPPFTLGASSLFAQIKTMEKKLKIKFKLLPQRAYTFFHEVITT